MPIARPPTHRPPLRPRRKPTAPKAPTTGNTGLKRKPRFAGGKRSGSFLKIPETVPTPGLAGGRAAAAAHGQTMDPPTPQKQVYDETHPPPPTVATQGSRNQAVADYGISVEDVNRQLRDLALGYGGVDNVEQYAFSADPTNPYRFTDTVGKALVAKNDPLSKTYLTEQQRIANQRDNDFSRNRADTNDFFSGANQLATQQIGNNARNSLEQARREYEAAVATLVSQLMTARGNRDRAFSDALSAEITAANAVEPQAEATPEPPPAPAPAAPATTNPNAQYDQYGRLITAAGNGRPSIVLGKDSHGNVGYWHYYADGRKPVFVKKK